MSAVISCPTVFAVNRTLRAYAAEHNIGSKQLLNGCRVALKEIADGRTATVAIIAGEKAMRGEVLQAGSLSA